MENNFQQDLDYTNLDIKLKKPKHPSLFETKTKGGILRFLILIAIMMIGILLLFSLISKSKQLSKLQLELIANEDAAKRTREERKNVANELKALKDENNDISRTITDLSSAKTQLTSNLAMLEKENEVLARDVIGYNEDLILSQKEINDLTTKNNAMVSEIEQLSILNRSIDKQIQELKNDRPLHQRGSHA